MPRIDAPRDTARDAWSITLFDDRYGLGAQERLLAMLREPCQNLCPDCPGVRRDQECVRQWHRRLLRDAPTGHERQRQCRQLRRKRLSKDPLLLGFYRRIRAQIPDARLTLVPSHDGYRSRSIRVNDRLVGLTRAAWLESTDAAGYVLTCATWTVDYVYCELGDTDFLFLPRCTTRIEEGTSLHGYRNSFDAFEPAPVRARTMGSGDEAR